MIIHNFDPVLIDLGFFQLRWYSIAYILGIILGWIYANKIIKKTINKNDSYSVKQKEHCYVGLLYFKKTIAYFFLRI